MIDHKHGNRLLGQLVGLGFVYFLTGIVLTYMIFTAKYYFGFFNMWSLIIGAIAGFIGTYYVQPGGTVNFYLRIHKSTPEEKELDMLIKEHRSTLLITATAFIYAVILIITYIPNFYLNYEFNLNNVVGMTVLAFLSMGGLCTGIKFISSWWNIKKR